MEQNIDVPAAVVVVVKILRLCPLLLTQKFLMVMFKASNICFGFVLYYLIFCLFDFQV